jgi:hypothetical protein
MGARWKFIMMSVLFLLQGMHASAMAGTASASAEGQKLGESKEQVVAEPTQSQLPGNRLVTGRILSIRSNQMEIDIGNVKSLYVPLRPAQVKGQTLHSTITMPWSIIIIPMNGPTIRYCTVV